MVVVTFLNLLPIDIFHKYFYLVLLLYHTFHLKEKYSLKVPRFNADYFYRDIGVKDICNMSLFSILFDEQP